MPHGNTHTVLTLQSSVFDVQVQEVPLWISTSELLLQSKSPSEPVDQTFTLKFPDMLQWDIFMCTWYWSWISVCWRTSSTSLTDQWYRLSWIHLTVTPAPDHSSITVTDSLIIDHRDMNCNCPSVGVLKGLLGDVGQKVKRSSVNKMTRDGTVFILREVSLRRRKK